MRTCHLLLFSTAFVLSNIEDTRRSGIFSMTILEFRKRIKSNIINQFVLLQ